MENSNIIILSNYGAWGMELPSDALNDDGSIKDEPIYLKSKVDGDSIGLSMADIDLLIEARDKIIAAQEEFKLRLPTEPGLYVHPKFTDVDTTTLAAAAILKLSTDGKWYYHTTFEKPGHQTEERVREFKRTWGGLVPLRAIKPE